MHKESVKAFDILEEIKNQEYEYIINNNYDITDKTNNKIKQIEWEKLSMQNEELIEKKDKESVQIEDPTWGEMNIRNLEENKNLTTKLLPTTRLKWFKRIIMRLMMTSTRWQEEFNIENISLLRQCVDKIKEQELDIAKLKNELLSTDNYSKQLSSLKQKYLDLTNEMDQKYNNEIYNMKSNFENLTEIIKKNQMEMVVNSNYVLKEEFNSFNKELNRRLKSNEDWMESIGKRIAGDEQWIDTINQTIRKNEEWLNLESNKIKIQTEAYSGLRNELFYEMQKHIEKKEERNKIKNLRIKDSFYSKIKHEKKVKINLGCGPQDIQGYINIDMRDLPNVDVVTDILHLPFETEEVDEILTSHLIEHFTIMKMKNEIMPYWFNILKKGGKLVSILPNIGVMAEKYADGNLEFDSLASLISGGQEYEGNYHLAVYNPDRLERILRETGFSHIETVESMRKNGLCYEMEIHAYK